MRLMPPDEMGAAFQGLGRTCANDERTFASGANAFDDETWYRFGRNQNLDKQDIPKLIVAQTVPEMRVCADSNGTKYLNNVRVNGILPREPPITGICSAP